jgi:hypothetical protein
VPCRLLSLLLLAALAGCSGNATLATTPSPTVSGRPAAGLSVAANRLVDSNGKAIGLFGVNRSGAEYACIDGFGIFDGPSDAASIAAMVSWHINAVRVPLNEDCWLGINGVPQRFAGSAYQEAIAAYVRRLRQAGLYVILDLHWSAPGQSPANALLPMPDQDHAPTFWKEVAKSYGSDSSVIFDLFNEPYPDNQRDTTAAWRCVRDGGRACDGLLIDQKGTNWIYRAAGMQSLVDAVRSTGAGNVILSPGVAFSETLDRWLEYRPQDPMGRVAASWHTYNFNSCVTAACWDAQIAPTAAQVPLITGEFGEDDCATGYITPLLTWLDAHQASYLGWAWNVSTCKGGPDLITNYSGTPSAYGAGYRDHLAHQPAPPPAPQPPTPPAAAAPPGASWQYQLQGTVDTTVSATVFDVDGFATPAATVAAIHADHHYALCYINAGAWESFRPDASKYPSSLLGKAYPGYPDERWIDIRDQASLRPILLARLRTQCQEKGFDGVEWDNVEAYNQDTGFALTPDDQLRFNRWLAQVTHDAGLRVALKNDRDQAQLLEPAFDYAVDEECQQYTECPKLQPFIAAGKAVFDVEYVAAHYSCPGPAGISVILKSRDLFAAPRLSCQ